MDITRILAIIVIVAGALSSIAVLSDLGFFIGHAISSKIGGTICAIIDFIVWLTAAVIMWVAAASGQMQENFYNILEIYILKHFYFPFIKKRPHIAS